MVTKRRVVHPNETKTNMYDTYVLMALGLLGGSAYIREIHEPVHTLMQSILTPEDHALMCMVDGHENLAPVGVVKGTWEIWVGRVEMSLLHLRREGHTTVSKGVHSLTTVGIKVLARLAVDAHKGK